ncbi:carboxypeptidase-like regulatory domain-containing protein [Polaribacter haliotis]|uniref:Carboxypeptidase-like regulatory domain-containing protein n=1 Tax=Polaribacter haliotis TaxID=1888915 RepID=A0A7L8AE60_9FLAO|nr:carboxypeptidase-like regulatory domain-containing protein [Polaribacter haliotis]QOD60271.1 carboxypeptidase-like regulatory domain-containing protein [Polaribacter haliotis]
MKKILLLTIFMVSFITSAQVKLTGVVKDSIGVPLEMANVLAINKTTKKMTSYGFTDIKGNYKLDLDKNSTFDIKISYIGMKTSEFVVTTTTENIVKNITMLEDNSLDEITIVSKMPVTIKGDTIVYNADSFKNGSERKLEDVLEKLPGVEINDAGQIEVEGKVVEKITVDGKEFFSGDTKLASKNIPSNAVDKIEVLRNYGDVGQLSGVQNNQDRVAINIKLKEGKKNFWFGDVTAGAGSAPDETLYLFQPKLFYYSPKYTINVIGDVNNLGDVVLDRGDLRSFGSNFRSQSPSNGTNISIANAGIGFLTAGARNANKIETKLSALNFSYSPNKKLDLTGFLIWSSNSNGQRNIRDIDYIDPATPDDFVDNTTNQTSNTGLFRFSSIYKKNINNQLNYNVSGRFSNEFKTESVDSRVLSDITERERATPYTINQDFSYFYTANENNIFAIEVKHLLQDEDPFYIASLENDPNNNDDVNNDGFDDAAETLGLDRSNSFYNLEQDRKVKSNQLDAKLDYYHILNSKSNLNFVAGTILSKQNFDSRFFQILDNGTEFTPNPTIDGITDPQTTNDTEYNFTDLYAGVRYRLKAGIFTFTPGFTVHSYNSNNTQYGTEYFQDTFVEVLPEFEALAQFKKSESLTFSYKKQVNFTDVNQIARGIVANSYNSYFAGNANLINASTHNASLFYRSFNLFNNTNVFARINYNKTADQVNRNTIFEPGSVVSSSTNLNSPFDNESFSSFVNAGKRFGKIQTSIGANYSFSKTYQFINDSENTNESLNRGLNTRIGTNFREAPNVTLRYRVNFSDQDNSARTEVIKSVTHAPSIDFDAYIWNSVTLTSDFTFNEVRQRGSKQSSFNIWNAKLAYRKDKDAKWEYELVGNNLLGTGSETSVSQGLFSFTVNERFILPRFVSLRVRYQL